ncbi:hypothetical protein AVEN_146263-1 [Araneus ventricosus]|uniref:Uncharacterized protein n=1 Tax=Araneus ventricosus TaxID=182803 RepID=A0A4Y2GFW0_ARAVE|nr:hypothetical protein AVEN_146263-1 [Araneus ventricosus]
MVVIFDASLVNCPLSGLSISVGTALWSSILLSSRLRSYFCSVRHFVSEVLKKREGSWDGRCHFEPWSDDKDGTLAGTLSKLPHHTSGGTLGTADLLENRVSSLEPSGPETETLSLCR